MISPEDIKQLTEVGDEYKQVLFTFIDKYGSDLELTLSKAARGFARVQYDQFIEYIKCGFTRDEAMELLISTTERLRKSINSQNKK